MECRSGGADLMQTVRVCVWLGGCFIKGERAVVWVSRFLEICGLFLCDDNDDILKKNNKKRRIYGTGSRIITTAIIIFWNGFEQLRFRLRLHGYQLDITPRLLRSPNHPSLD